MSTVPPQSRANIAKLLATMLGLGVATTAILVDDISEDEGWMLTSYQDSAGVWTICLGVTGPDIVEGLTFTVAECEYRSAAEIAKHAAPVLEALVNPDAGEIIAWVGFAYNVGVRAFLQSSARRLQAVGRKVEACQQLLRWVYITVAGEKRDCRVKENRCSGLPARRERQLERCMQSGTILVDFRVI